MRWRASIRHWRHGGSMTWRTKFDLPPKPGLLPLKPLKFIASLTHLHTLSPFPSLHTLLKSPHAHPLHRISLLCLPLYLYYYSRRRRDMKGGRSKTESKKANSKLSVKKGAPSAGKKPAAKKGKAAKDPNAPKRPVSAFFVFMEDFRKQFKEKHPNNKSIAAVGKAGGDKWKSMSDAEKAPFIAKAEKRKAEYEKTLQAYNKKKAEGNDAEEESDKSKSEVHDDEDDDDEGSAEDDDDDEDDED